MDPQEIFARVEEICTLCDSAPVGRCDECHKDFCQDHCRTVSTLLGTWHRCLDCMNRQPESDPLLSEEDRGIIAAVFQKESIWQTLLHRWRPFG